MLLRCQALATNNDSGAPTDAYALGIAAMRLDVAMIALVLQAGADPVALDADCLTARDRLPSRNPRMRRAHAWRGLAVYGVDENTVRVPDSAENAAHFGEQDTRWDSTSGYPLVRLVMPTALRSHILAGLALDKDEQLCSKAPNEALAEEAR